MTTVDKYVRLWKKPSTFRKCHWPMDMSDITFPIGTTFVLVIDTDKYSGNFELELCGYVTGIHDDERRRGEAEADEARLEEPRFVASMNAKSVRLKHNEYGFVSNDIRTTPGRLKDGYGFHYDEYKSVAVFFKQLPGVEEMQTIRKRTADYCAANDIGVCDVYMVKVERCNPVETRLEI